MNTTVFAITLLAVLVISYFVIKRLASRYFVKLYRETGRNMINKPRQLLAYVAGLSFFLGLLAIADEAFRSERLLVTLLLLIAVPVISVLILILTNRSIGGKRVAWCTLYQLGLGFCFVGRIVAWVFELIGAFCNMALFGESGKIKWHPFFFTIIRDDGTTVERKSANIALNEEGSVRGSFDTAQRIESEMNETRLSGEQRRVSEELRIETDNLEQALREGRSGVDEQQRIDALQKERDRLEAQRKNANKP